MKKIVDSHAHIYPDEIAEKVISSIEDFYHSRRKHDGTLAALLGSIEDGAVDYVVVLPVASKPEHFKTNEWYANLAKISPRIVPFGSIHPDNHPSDLERFPAWGLKGIKFQPNAQLFFPDEGRMFPFYQKAEELQLITTFHIGNEHGNAFGKFSQPESYVEVLRSFPNLKVILPHLGGYMTWDRLELTLEFPNVYYDTAYLPGNIEDALFMELVEEIGIERILFGTDFPFRDHAEELAHIRRLLGEEAEKILWLNPKRVLGLT
jgi:predicted TIM-barrel fold metal-dependent hydrolase